LGLQDSTGSDEFDAIASLARDILECPIALISVLGETDQWFKAKCGLDVEIGPRETAFCNYTILSPDLLIVNDAREDVRFKNNPIVVREPNVVFYAGAPISIDGIHNLGTLCVVDTQPRQLTEQQIQHLRGLARATSGLMKAFTSKRQAEIAKLSEMDKGHEVARMANFLKQTASLSGVGGWELVLESQKLTWTDETKIIHDVPLDFVPKLDEAIEFYMPEARPVITKAVENAMATGVGWDLELPILTAQGRNIWVRAVGSPTYRDGVLVSLNGAVQDISERKLNEARLLKSETSARSTAEELRAILDNMEEGVSVFDKDAKLLIWNQKYIDIFEKAPGEVREGVKLRRLLENEKFRGNFDGDIATHLRELFCQLDRNEPSIKQFRTKSGKIIKSTHAPRPGGGWVGTHSDVTVPVLASEHHEHASRHDHLTGLMNRLAFNTWIEKFCEHNTDPNRCLVLLLLDLDKFKHVNDTLGHVVGDKLLQYAATRLQNCVRDEDVVARLGGDEFAVVLECAREESIQIAGIIADNAIRAIGSVLDLNGEKVEIGVSIGICVSPLGKFELDELLTRADFSLYQAKENGRGNYCYHDPSLVDLPSRQSRKNLRVGSAA
tara:strand:+ start:470 stop:2302 length:1833 start_codon:yes stop_codon:yes gene_type:complete